MSKAKPIIVLLEDDWRIAQMIVEYFEDAGYEVRQTADVASARTAVDAVGGQAILVADRALGAGPNGFAFAHEALARHPALKVVYTSSLHIAMRHQVLGAREASLPKPFAMAQLLGTVKALAAA